MAINQIAIRNSEGNFENLFPLAVNKGGTGATDATTARNNLGAAASSHSHSWSSITGKPSALTYMPVGYIYISWSSTSPATLFGGSWTAITGRFPYFNAGTNTGGANSQVLTVAQMPKHTHTFDGDWPLVASGSVVNGITGSWGNGNISTGHRNAGYTGSNDSINNMPAYQTLYAWRRTA